MSAAKDASKAEGLLAIVSEMEDCLRAADEAWDQFIRDVRFAARRGLPTDPVIERWRPVIEAAVLGEPDPRDFAVLTFDEQRQAFARLKRQWARDALCEGRSA